MRYTIVRDVIQYLLNRHFHISPASVRVVVDQFDRFLSHRGKGSRVCCPRMREICVVVSPSLFNSRPLSSSLLCATVKIADTSSDVILAYDQLSAHLRSLGEEHLPLGINALYQVRTFPISLAASSLSSRIH